MFYHARMKYTKTLIILIILATLIIFGVNNTQTFELAFFGYCLARPLELWILLTGFFFAGMVAMFLIGLPEKISIILQTKSLEKKLSLHENNLKSSEETKTSSEPR